MFHQVQELFARQLPNQFHNLPQDAMLNIVSRMPVVDIIRSRLVSKKWRAMLSPPLPGSSSSDTTPYSAYFLKTFWMENRPMERWLFLHTERILNHSLLYDVLHNICYKWRPNPELASLITLAHQRLTLCNTTANGLIFLKMLQRDVNANTPLRPAGLTIWTYNPLTGCQDQLPGIPCSNPQSLLIVAKNDAIATTNFDPHYKVLVLWDNNESLRTSAKHHRILDAQRKFHVFVYSSKERSWQRHESFSSSRVIINLCEIKRFYEHDFIYILERSNNRSLVGYRPCCIIRWFNVEDYNWHSCKVCPPLLEAASMRNSIEFYDIFERNKELILISVLVDSFTGNLELLVYKSSSIIEAGMHISWVLLGSKMGNMVFVSGQGRIAPAAEKSETPTSQRRLYILYDDIQLQVFPLPDKVEGDKLIIILIHRSLGSFSVISFNFRGSPADAWKTLIPAGNLHDPLTTREQKIGQWTQSTQHPRWPIQSGPYEGFTFEPRLNDLQAAGRPTYSTE